MSDIKKKINYTVVYVNEFAKRFNIASKDAFIYLYDHKGIEFIKEHYDIEHTLSLDDAVDNLALLFRQYENGMITFENMLSGMIYKKTTNQYSFHTEKAIALLKKVGV